MEQVSTIVVINGDAMIAGSMRRRFARIGRMHPTNFAITIVTTSEAATTTAMGRFLYTQKMRTPFANARTTPTTIATRNSVKCKNMSLISRKFTKESRVVSLPHSCVNVKTPSNRLGTNDLMTPMGDL